MWMSLTALGLACGGGSGNCQTRGQNANDHSGVSWVAARVLAFATNTLALAYCERMPNVRGLPAVAIALVFWFGCTSTAPVHKKIDSAQIERILDEQRREQHLPGLAFVVVQHDRVVFTNVQGFRDIGGNLPVTLDTVFPIGSCTKAFTSMAIALSADRGLLSFDDHPQKFLPYFHMMDPEANAQVTIRDMLSHRTGLKANADLSAEPGVLTREEYVRAATAAKPAVKFRSAFQYSNAMYSAAGEIVGKTQHSTWETAVQSMIFDPLGMRASTTSAQRAMTQPDHATGYEYDATTKDFRAVPPPRSLDALAPAGSIESSARDLTQWLRTLTNSGAIDGRQFVSSQMFHELTTPLTTINATTSYALGWATYQWNGLHVVEHNGGSQGISALVSFIPERHVGFVFLANTTPNFMTKIGNAGNLLWPIILNMTAPSIAANRAQAPATAATPSTSQRASDAPSTESLILRMIDALGGEANLRRHVSKEIRARKSYENQGVLADVTIDERAPSLHDEREIWTAAGREIASLRIYFDGKAGGQETTFGQDAVNDAEGNARARRDYALHALLDLARLYKTITVREAATVGEEPAWELELMPEHGWATRLYVSQKTSLILIRESEGETKSFDDYRDVDGELVPFHITIHDALGDTALEITSVHFNLEVPDEKFRASAPGG